MIGHGRLVTRATSLRRFSRCEARQKPSATAALVAASLAGTVMLAAGTATTSTAATAGRAGADSGTSTSGMSVTGTSVTGSSGSTHATTSGS